jgi:uracil-DNA glycosylase
MSLGNYAECKELHSRKFEPHVEALNAVVKGIRKFHGLDWQVPWFDPNGGGIDARVLFILEAPGPKTVISGFISVDNPDQTARNWKELLAEAGIAPKEICIWNIYPIYISEDDGNNREPSPEEIFYGIELIINRLLPLFKKDIPICLVGNHSGSTEHHFTSLGYTVFRCPHPSQRSLNRYPIKRDEICNTLKQIRKLINLAIHT